MAWIPKAERDGVEAFLGACLRPEVGDRFPSVPKIFVNLPSGLRAHRRGENEEIVGPTDVVETTRGGGVALSYPSSFEKVETDMDQEQSALASAPANEEHSLQSADELREIISDIRHWHNKDNKDDDHWDDECLVCAALARVRFQPANSFRTRFAVDRDPGLTISDRELLRAVRSREPSNLRG